MRLPEFRANLSQLKAQPGDEAEPFARFLRLASPTFEPAPPDVELTFDPQPLNLAQGPWKWIGAISLNGTGTPAIAVANGHEVRLSTGAIVPFPGGAAAVAPSPEGVVPVDFNYDFKTDLLLAGAGGLRFLQQDQRQTFIDVTAKTKLPNSVTSASYTGAWAVDIEADGDLDIVAASKDKLPLVLRNNSDGTFEPEHPFSGISGVRQFVWADLNGDGNPDASLIDGSGRLHVFLNERLGKFREVRMPTGSSTIEAIAAADVNHFGPLTLLAVLDSGAITSLALRTGDGGWTASDIAAVPNHSKVFSGEVRLRVADLDNNGAFDLLLAPISSAGGAMVWLQNTDSKFQLLNKTLGEAHIFDVADTKGDGRLNLLGLSADGQPIETVNQGAKQYHWQVIRPRARQTTGDQRVNSFGIGGEIEIRSGLLVQKQTINGPELHFGLGNQTSVDVARIIWPNGSVRAEFALKVDQPVITEQRLKGFLPVSLRIQRQRDGVCERCRTLGIGNRLTN